jgi:hypothetical protein
MCCFEHRFDAGWTAEDHLCIFELNFHNSGVIVTPALVNSKCLPGECPYFALLRQLSMRHKYAVLAVTVSADCAFVPYVRRVDCLVLFILRTPSLQQAP